jgi:CheY-like chemotaxis protein
MQPERPLVLLVEDDDDAAELMTHFLSAAHFEVVRALDGVEAVGAALRLRPDAIVMDFDLPWRNGCDAAHLLKMDRRTHNIPIVLLTGRVDRHVDELARQSGCDAYLTKPCPLPRLRDELVRLLVTLERAEPRAAERVMVVEDDAAIRGSLIHILEEEGYEVSEASNGYEALARLRSRQAQPHVILLDLMMPVMNGWQFRDEQRRDPRIASIPVVVLTAFNDARRESTRLQAASCLEKPLRLHELFDVLERAVAHRAA